MKRSPHRHLDVLVTRIPLHGDYDVTSRAELRALLHFRDLEIDASGVTFIDCSALRALATVRRRTLREGGTFTITGASLRYRRICSAAGYPQLLPPARPSRPDRGTVLG